jgi:hypothetical protein
MQMQFPDGVALHRTSLSAKTAEFSNEWMNFRVRLTKGSAERLVRGSLSPSELPLDHMISNSTATDKSRLVGSNSPIELQDQSVNPRCVWMQSSARIKQFI